MKRNKGKGKGIRTNIPEQARRTLTQIIELTDSFCDTYLNEDYRQLCEDMAAMLYAVGVPIEKGRPVSWASGIVHALGWVNFLQDPQLSPCMSSTEVAKGFGVSQGTMLAKSRIIRDELNLIQLDPEWCLPSLLADNPLVWMLDVNGFIMDIRVAPRELQEEAYRLGLIPFIPTDEQEPELRANAGPKIIEFTSKQKEDSRTKTNQKSKVDEPKLFE